MCVAARKSGGSEAHRRSTHRGPASPPGPPSPLGPRRTRAGVVWVCGAPPRGPRHAPTTTGRATATEQPNHRRDAGWQRAQQATGQAERGRTWKENAAPCRGLTMRLRRGCCRRGPQQPTTPWPEAGPTHATTTNQPTKKRAPGSPQRGTTMVMHEAGIRRRLWWTTRPLARLRAAPVNPAAHGLGPGWRPRVAAPVRMVAPGRPPAPRLARGASVMNGSSHAPPGGRARAWVGRDHPLPVLKHGSRSLWSLRVVWCDQQNHRAW